MLKQYVAARKIYYRLFKRRDFWHNRHNHPYLDIERTTADQWRILWRRTTLNIAPVAHLLKPTAKRCHIIASGPSIRTILRPERLFDAPTICLNGSFQIAADAGLEPDFYMVSDAKFIAEDFSRFCRGLKICHTFIAHAAVVNAIVWEDHRVLAGATLVYYDDLLRPFRRDRIDSWRGRPVPAALLVHPGSRIAFSTDLELGVYPSGTVVYNALQFALGIGFEEVYIFGMDLGATPRFYQERSPSPNYLDRDYEDSIKPGFELVRTYLRRSSQVVYNCSLSSRLPAEILPKLDPNVALESLAGNARSQGS